MSGVTPRLQPDRLWGQASGWPEVRYRSPVARVALSVIWLVAVGSVSALAFLAYEISKGDPVVPKATPIERLPARQKHNPWARWSITQHLSAHHVLIAHVETDYLAEAVAISQQIADPIKDRYVEVLIYFHRPGRPDLLAPRRVQWTATTGYVETVYE
jgi:hypothetical protein